MPTSKSKNLLYRAALPFLSPSIPKNPVKRVTGHPLITENKLSALLRRNHITGAALCLQSGQDTSQIFTQAVHTSLVADENTYFRVASITKMATAFLCTILMDQGLLDREAPVDELLPEGKQVDELREIRLHHLLSHTSGLADPHGLEGLLLKRAPYTEAIKGCRFHAPGEVFRYSNLGFGLIGCILESIFSQSVEQVYQQYLFHPLNLDASLEGASLPEDRIMPVIRILPYHTGTGIRVTRLGRLPITHPDSMLHYGYTAGSMYITLPSLLRLTACIRDHGSQFLSSSYANYMKQDVISYGDVSPTLSYGHGLLIVRDRRISDSTVYGHQGFAYGCVDGAFWEESTGNILLSLNGGCSESRSGRFGTANLDLCRWAFRKELPVWK